MSDSEETTNTKTEKQVVFTEKEEAVMKVAWRCLKSGPPEIDMEKLTKLGGFNTTKTASNTWGVIKKKLFAGADTNALPSTPGTPAAKTPKAKKGTATPTPKKRTKKDLDDDDEEEEGKSIFNKGAKRSASKKIKAENSDDE